MKKIIFAATIIAAWGIGIYEGDCTAAVMLSLFGCFAAMDKLTERKREK